MLRPESSMNVASLSSSFPFPFEPARIQEAFFTPLPPSHFHSSAPPDVPSSPPDVTSFLHPLLPKFKRDENLGELVSLRGSPQSVDVAAVRDKLAYLFHLPRHSSSYVVSYHFSSDVFSYNEQQRDQPTICPTKNFPPWTIPQHHIGDSIAIIEGNVSLSHSKK